jgi:hypothetical protein
MGATVGAMGSTAPPRERTRVLRYLEDGEHFPPEERDDAPEDLSGLIWEDLFASD